MLAQLRRAPGQIDKLAQRPTAAQDSAQPTQDIGRAHGGQMDRATAGRTTHGAQGITEGDRGRGQDRRQEWTGTTADGHRGPKDAPTL